MVNKKFLPKNWVVKTSTTAYLAFLPDFSAIIGAEPSKYSPPAVVTVNSECQTAYNQNLGGYTDKDGTKYWGNPRLMAR